ncbi:MAG: serine hydroxymethyltransferase, partial [Patescibacteria group bacterium]
KQLENPVPYFDVVSTTTHKTLRGPRGAMIMCKEKFASAIDKAVFPGVQGGPHDHINAAKAVAYGEALRPEFQEYSAQIIKNARALAGALQAKGYRIVSGGTDNHLMLIDLFGSKQITCKEGEKCLEHVGISINKNMIPFDPRKPMDPSGIRVGTPALTTRGCKEKDMQTVADLMDSALMNRTDENKLKQVSQKVKEFSLKFPVPAID